jgi:hypothetical protein
LFVKIRDGYSIIKRLYQVFGGRFRSVITESVYKEPGFQTATAATTPKLGRTKKLDIRGNYGSKKG